MKKMILALVAVFALTMGAQAQDNGKKEAPQRPSKEEMIQKQTDLLADSLGLTEEQKAAVLALNTEYADKMGPQMRHPRGPQMKEGEEVSEDAPEAPEEMSERPEMKPEMGEDPRAEYSAKMKEILTEEQYAKYETLEKRMMRHGGRPGGPMGKGPRGEGDGPRGPQAPQGEGGCAPCCPACPAE